MSAIAPRVAEEAPPPGGRSRARRRDYLPGLVVVGAVVAAAFGVGALIPSLSPVIAAVLIGVLAAPVVRPYRSTAAGTGLAARTLLRIGVALLGLRIALSDIAAVGWAGAVIVTLTILATLGGTALVSRRLRAGRDVALLIAVGTAICGASAIAATESLIRAEKRDVGYAVAVISLLGSVAMIIVPLAGRWLGLTDHQTALWVGASIHEVAQVAGAGAGISAAGLALATLVKLGRVTLLAPTMVGISLLRGEGRQRTEHIPTFVLVFVALVLVRTLVPLPDGVLTIAEHASTGLLAAGLAGLGLGISLSALRAEGLRPLAVGLVAWGLVAGVSLVLVLVLGGPG
jgi:uncharacterized integral membrane protein (TIGR00698 family)